MASEGPTPEPLRPPQKTAPAPPPPPGQAPAAFSPGFDPKPHKTLLGVLVLVGIVIGGGVLAVTLGGTLAAALVPVVPLSVDTKLGELSEQSMGTSNECPRPEALAYVKALAAPLLEQAAPLPFPFHFRVVVDEEVNAFALPGGYVTVNQGLLQAAESSEEVAGVLAHEIQHALQRHGTRRMLREMGGSVALSALLGGTDLAAYGAVAAQLVHRSYDRDQESEADRLGVALLGRAGIDPAGLGRFFERLEHEAPLHPPLLLSTHPDSGERAALARAARPVGPLRVLPQLATARCE